MYLPIINLKYTIMKKVFLLVVILPIILLSCSRDDKKSIEGVWKMVSAQWIDTDSTVYLIPKDIQGSQIKIWLNGYVTLAGTFKVGTTNAPSYCAAKYNLDGNKYEEIIIYHDYTVPEGSTVKMILEIHNDTLIHKWPTDDNWNLNEKAYMYEKYVRLK